MYNVMVGVAIKLVLQDHADSDNTVLHEYNYIVHLNKVCKDDCNSRHFLYSFSLDKQSKKKFLATHIHEITRLLWKILLSASSILENNFV